jgi:hypothetical protein
MLNLTPSMNYYLYPYPADMRRGFYSLSGLVHDVMGKDIRSGSVFIFINRCCTGMKILHMEYEQLVIYQVILPDGCFRLPDMDENTGALHTSWQNLMGMLQHIDKGMVVKRKKW